VLDHEALMRHLTAVEALLARDAPAAGVATALAAAAADGLDPLAVEVLARERRLDADAWESYAADLEVYRVTAGRTGVEAALERVIVAEAEAVEAATATAASRRMRATSVARGPASAASTAPPARRWSSAPRPP
jgi:hypothetical protein